MRKLWFAAALCLLLLIAPALASTDNAQGVDGEEKAGWIGTSGVVVTPEDDPSRPGVREYDMSIPSGGSAAFGFSQQFNYAAMTASGQNGAQLSVFDESNAKHAVGALHERSARSDHQALVYDGKMWVLGGSSRNDVWCSTDGESWTQVTSSAGWSARDRHQ
ncbi:MAG: hypothetical protein WC083_06880, partial [Candidatus Methanomethylophilaceae archaeon]